MHRILSACLLALAGAVAADPRYALYYDQYHKSGLPNKALTAGINTVITAFASSSLFVTDPVGNYTPFQPLNEIRPMFDPGTKLCMAIGGWGDNAGFDEGAKTAESRERFAKNVANTVDRLGYDCVDMDWEYPGGNGADYKKILNEEKAWEIEAYPLFLQAIKDAIGNKNLSIAVPGREQDMIAYTAAQIPKINEAVDYVHVMSYDMLNRRDKVTGHQTSLQATLDTVDIYIARGFSASKLLFGIPFYAKWFTTQEGIECTEPLGCPMEVLEDAQGGDTGKAGTTTFQKGYFGPPPTNLTESTDLICGVGTWFKCGEDQCCSHGNTTAHCGTGCQPAFGSYCEGADVTVSLKKALANGKTDLYHGGQWYWDADTRLFWTWDTAELIRQKIWILLDSRGIGGFFAWSIGEDDYDWSHLQAMQDGYRFWQRIDASRLGDE